MTKFNERLFTQNFATRDQIVRTSLDIALIPEQIADSNQFPFFLIETPLEENKFTLSNFYPSELLSGSVKTITGIGDMLGYTTIRKMLARESISRPEISHVFVNDCSYDRGVLEQGFPYGIAFRLLHEVFARPYIFEELPTEIQNSIAYIITNGISSKRLEAYLTLAQNEGPNIAIERYAPHLAGLSNPGAPLDAYRSVAFLEEKRQERMRSNEPYANISDIAHLLPWILPHLDYSPRTLILFDASHISNPELGDLTAKEFDEKVQQVYGFDTKYIGPMERLPAYVLDIPSENIRHINWEHHDILALLSHSVTQISGGKVESLISICDRPFRGTNITPEMHIANTLIGYNSALPGLAIELCNYLLLQAAEHSNHKLSIIDIERMHDRVRWLTGYESEED